MDKDEILLEFAKLNLAHSQKHEEMREKVLSIILAITAGCLTILNFSDAQNKYGIYIPYLFILLGIFSAIISIKHYERFNFHYNRFRFFRNALDLKFGVLDDIQNRSDINHKSKGANKYVWEISLNILWTLLAISPTVIGILLLMAR